MCPFNIIIDILIPFQSSSIMFYIFFSLISSCDHGPIYDGKIETLSGLLPCMVPPVLVAEPIYYW